MTIHTGNAIHPSHLNTLFFNLSNIPSFPLYTLTHFPFEKFLEKNAIEKCIEGLLPGQLASHLTREPPKTLEELYTEAEKYAKSDADHRRRVEQRRIMRQAEKYN